MYKLYWSSNSGAFIVHAALEEAGADYELIEIDFDAGEHKRPEFLALNPKGQVPMLDLGDGSILTESVAIVLHLADVFPRAALLPDTGSLERANAYRWLLFMATNTYNEDLRYYYSERYTTETDQAEGIKEAAEAQMGAGLDQLDAVLDRQPYLAGKMMSVADTYLAMMVTWYPHVDDLLFRCGNIDRVVKEVYNRPVIQDVWEQNYPDGPFFD